MRATLEQLKAMSNAERYQHWIEGEFPFERINGCGQCLTQHALLGGDCHKELREQLEPLKEHWRHQVIAVPPEIIEELYALRLFYNSLYPASKEVEASAEQILAAIPS